jgi:transcriptional regulator with XRE-family HTH domain
MLGSDLKDARERRGLGQRETARLAGISPETLSNLERGDGYPNLHTLECIAGVLQVRIVINSTETFIELE